MLSSRNSTSVAFFEVISFKKLHALHCLLHNTIMHSSTLYNVARCFKYAHNLDLAMKYISVFLAKFCTLLIHILLFLKFRHFMC